MKKILLLAILVVAATAYGTTPDKKKKKKKDKTENVVPQVTLATPSDTLSYAAGMSATRGLVRYIEQEYKVDSTHIGAFVEGFKEAINSSNDPEATARHAGMQIAEMVKQRILPSAAKQFEGSDYTISSDIFNAAFIAAVLNDTTIMNVEQAADMFTNTNRAVQKEKEAEYKSENEQWLSQNASKEGVKTTASGLQYKIITAGTGETPKATDKVKVKYEGKLIDGTVFDSSYKRNPDTSSFRADQVIKGWTEALTMMPVGSKWELYIPAELGYGSRQAGQIKPNSTLIFTVELVEIEKPEPKPATTTTDETKAGNTTKTATKSTAKPARRATARKK